MDGSPAQRIGRTQHEASGRGDRPGTDTATSGRDTSRRGERGASRPTSVAAARPSHGEPIGTADSLSAFRTNLVGAIGAEAFERHLGSDVRMAEVDGGVRIDVRSIFHKGVLERRFAEALRSALDGTGLAGLSIEVSESMRERQRTAGTSPAAAPKQPRQRPAQPLRYELSSFVVGPSNRMAFSAVRRVASEDHGREFSPLFLHGVSGVGKTHLLQGAAAEFTRRRPDAKVRYTTAEAFTNSYITAVRSNKLESFRRTWRGVDLLCIDDVHFFSGKVSTQSELLHTFDAIDLEGACVVLASDAHPRQIRELSAGLVSRLLSGAVVRIDPPDEHLRHELIRRLAAKRGAALTEDATVLLASRAGVGQEVSVRDLEGMVTQVIAVAELLPEFLGQRQEIGILAVKKALGLGEWTQSRTGSTKPAKLETIIQQACECLGVELHDIYGRTRHRRVVLARTLIAYLARTMTTRSFPEIARAMHRPTHSTIVAAKQRYETQIEQGEMVSVGSGVDGLTMGQLAERVRAQIESAR